MKTKIIAVRGMPEDLWQQVRILAAKQGISVQKLVIALLRDGVRQAEGMARR